MITFKGNSFAGKSPQIADTACCDVTAKIIGDVFIGEHAVIAANCLIRGDGNSVSIGCHSSVGDGAVIHTADALPVVIGDYVSIGPRALIHVATLEDCCRVGAGAVVLNGAVIGRGSVVAAGAVVSRGMKAPPFSILEGVPARITGTVQEKQLS